MLGQLKLFLAAVTFAVIAIMALSASTAAAQDDCSRFCDGEVGQASTGPTGLSARVGAGGGVSVLTSGGSSNCVYTRLDSSGAFGGSGELTEAFQLEDGTVGVWSAWQCLVGDPASCDRVGGNVVPGASFDEATRSFFDCDGDGVADGETGDILVEIGNTTELSAFALDEIPWPELEIRTGMANPVSGFPIPLVLDDGAGTTFDTEFEAIAEDNGLSVTATATAREVAWFTGHINSYWQSRVGGDWPTDETVCTDFGRDLTAAPPPIWEVVPTEEEYGCVTAFRASSHTEPGERVTLESSVFYDVEYEVNLVGTVALGLPEWELTFVSEPIQVREIQSIVVAE